MKILIIIALIATLISYLLPDGIVCIEGAGKVWCEPESPISPLVAPTRIYLPVVLR